MSSDENAAVIRRYSDEDGGQWLRVSHVHIVDLGFENDVYESESRMGLSWVYLAGGDGDRFEHKYLCKNGISPTFDDMPQAQRSTIRKMAPYIKAFLLFSAVPGRIVRIDGTLYRIDSISQRGSGRVFLESIA